MGANKDLGLPHGDGMEKIAFCFDVDGTLIDTDQENAATINLLMAVLEQKWKNVDVIVWSGGGKMYAEQMYRDYVSNNVSGVKFYSKLEHKQLRQKYNKIIAVDDIQDTRLGDVNMIVRNK